MKPDEIMKMKKNDCLILIEGEKPIKAKKLYWFKNLAFKKAIESTDQPVDSNETKTTGEA